MTTWNDDDSHDLTITLVAHDGHRLPLVGDERTGAVRLMVARGLDTPTIAYRLCLDPPPAEAGPTRPGHYSRKEPLTMTTITTVTVQLGEGKTVDVEGREVVAGLAITPSLGREPDRFCITHIPSGLALVPHRCAEHTDLAAVIVRDLRDAGIDWTRAKDALVADAAVKEAMQELLNTIGWCHGRCNPSTPAEPSWQVRCNTCDWEWEDEDNEGLPDAKAAKRMADDHECEPQVEIAPPDSTQWVEPYLVNDDGTVRSLVGAK